MKARNENGVVQFYSELPSTYRSDTLGLVLSGFDTLCEEVHEAEGFFDVVTPEFDFYTQELSPVYFDDAKKVFTYDVLQLEIPCPRLISERRLSKLEFVNLFTAQEFKAILAASKVNDDVELWMMKFNLAEYINPDSDEIHQGMQGLEMMGLLDQGRADEIVRAK